MMRPSNGMKSGSLLLRIAASAAALALVAGVAPRANAQADEVLKLQKQFQDASIAGDTATLSTLMADDAIFIHGNGAAQSKAEFLGSVTNGQLALSLYDLKDPKVVLFDGGAIVSGLVDIAFKAPPNATAPPRVLHMRGSSVWVHKAGKWALFLDQDTTLAGPPPAPPAH